MRKLSPWALWTLNFQVMTSLLADVAPRLRALRLEVKEFLLLSKLDEHPNPADLARALVTTKPSVTFMVKRMEALGYVKRELQALKAPADVALHHILTNELQIAMMAMVRATRFSNGSLAAGISGASGMPSWTACI